MWPTGRTTYKAIVYQWYQIIGLIAVIGLAGVDNNNYQTMAHSMPDFLLQV